MKTSKTIFEIKNLHTETKDKKILKGINLKIVSGEIHAVMGPNGSGKSTLCSAIMGHPKYKNKKGEIKLNNKSILKLETNLRANLGIFLAFQHPLEIPGTNFRTFLRTASKENLSILKFIEGLKSNSDQLSLNNKILESGINENLSGGEKKKSEILQMLTLKPKVIILDEIDSGLDIDSLKIVAKNIKKYFNQYSPAILLITHYARILNYIKPDHVHVISDGKIVKSGTKSLAKEIEKNGYKKYI